MSEPFITIQSREVEQYIAQLLTRLNNPGALMKGVGNELFAITDKAFTDKRSPDGTAWQPLSMLTIQRRAMQQTQGKQYRRDGKEYRAFTQAKSDATAGALVHTGSLLRTVRYQSTNTQARLMAGPHVSQVGIHQFGGMAGRGRKVHIPARPFMPIEGSGSNMDLMPVAKKRILDLMREFVEGGAT